MTRERGPQRSPLSPLPPSNHGGAAAPAADAVGSSTKDRTWQQQRRLGGGVNRPSRLQPASDQKKSKKVEGTLPEGGATAALAASRIPTGSRIPRPPLFAGASAAGASPNPSLLAMLATPAAAPLLTEMHQASAAGPASQQPLQQAWEAPQGFHAYSNPSFDGAQFLAATPAASGSAGGLAEAEAGAGQLTPGLLEPAALTPATERSLEAWLRSSPNSRQGGRAVAAAAEALSGARARGSSLPGTAGGSARGKPEASGSGGSRAPPMPTPEAWQLLQHINDDSPGAAPKGEWMIRKMGLAWCWLAWECIAKHACQRQLWRGMCICPSYMT